MNDYNNEDGPEDDYANEDPNYRNLGNDYES